MTPPSSNNHAVKIVPKGLRSFDAVDADFFLDLLPGPRDRDGLPDGIRFWKSRIETSDPEAAFSVGLVYGPSGCGKSSLVKAGCCRAWRSRCCRLTSRRPQTIPKLTCLNRFAAKSPDLPNHLGLVEPLSALRQGGSSNPARKW